jgi:deazaflavin-dependent oxidoreductase (nitroreductase family)
VRGEEFARCLGYPKSPPWDPMRRAVRWFAASRPASWALARGLPHVDAAVAGVSAGRLSATSLLAGLPIVRLETVGARTGRPRSVPLVPVVTAEAFAVLGTNFGGEWTPGWVHNLLAEPRARLAYGGRSVVVRARLLQGSERSDVVAEAWNVYPGFRQYQARASHRPVCVFALDARTSSPTG